MDYNNLILFLYVVIFANFLCQGYSRQEDEPQGKILGGRCTDIDKVPYQASLILNETSHKCGAVIIAKSWLITAAHCVDNQTLVKNYTVITGNSEIGNGGIRHLIENVILHPSFNNDTYDNDIALIKLQKNIKFGKEQRKIHITNQALKSKPQRQKMQISGFGGTSSDEASSQCLREVSVNIWTHKKCKKNYSLANITITKNMFCAGGAVRDVCFGDSGGPGVIKLEKRDKRLYGIVSFAKGSVCGSDSYPGVYTAVYNYREWIANITGISLNKSLKEERMSLLKKVLKSDIRLR